MKTGHTTTDAWLAKQAIWHDSDMFKAFTIGIAVGLFVGFIWGFGAGAPDLSGIISTGLKG
jgi:hypothetical protein